MSASKSASKQELRRRMRARRGAIPVAERMQWSESICQRVLSLPEVMGKPEVGEAPEMGGGPEVGSLAADEGIFCYVSMEGEVETHGLIRTLLATERPVAVPRLHEDSGMTAVVIQRFDGLMPGRFGVLEPPVEADADAADAAATSSASKSPPHVPIALVPGLAFTAGGDRLGQGGGYYDRWLAAHPDVLAVGLCFESQLVDDVPTTAHDRPMHLLVTERRVLRREAR